MLTAAPNPRAWAVAAALAAESGLRWGRWANGSSDLEERRGLAYAEEVKRCHAVGYSNELADAFAEAASDEVEPLPPVPAPWDADAYRADAARRGVEPGPLPSLEYGTRSSGVYWSVESDAHGIQAVIKVGAHEVAVAPRGVMVFPSFGDFDNLARAVTLATAAKRAMGGP